MSMFYMDHNPYWGEGKKKNESKERQKTLEEEDVFNRWKRRGDRREMD